MPSADYTPFPIPQPTVGPYGTAAVFCRIRENHGLSLTSLAELTSFDKLTVAQFKIAISPYPL